MRVQDIYFVLTSGTRGTFSTDQVASSGDLKRILDLLWIKLDERFRTMGEAFRYFDRNFNNSVSFGEFQKALDLMRIKFSVEQLDAMF